MTSMRNRIIAGIIVIIGLIILIVVIVSSGDTGKVSAVHHSKDDKLYQSASHGKDAALPGISREAFDAGRTRRLDIAAPPGIAAIIRPPGQDQVTITVEDINVWALAQLKIAYPETVEIDFRDNTPAMPKINQKDAIKALVTGKKKPETAAQSKYRKYSEAGNRRVADAKKAAKTLTLEKCKKIISCAALIDEARVRAFNFLVKNSWNRLEAQRKGLKPTADQINQGYDGLISWQSAPSNQKRVAAIGIASSFLVDAEYNKKFPQKIPAYPSDAQALAEYKKSPNLYGTSDQAVAQIVTIAGSKKDAENFTAFLRNNKNGTALEKKIRKQLTEQGGFDKHGYTQGGLEKNPQLWQLLSKAPLNQWNAPQYSKIEDAWKITRVLSRSHGKPLPMKELKNEIFNRKKTNVVINNSATRQYDFASYWRLRTLCGPARFPICVNGSALTPSTEAG